MSALAVEDFPAFFKAIHGHDPFLWQQRLLSEVVEKGEWPRTIAAPTGAGKTAVLDIALFHLAMEAHRGGERRAPVRICFAVDRRIIVDQAHERAKKIRDALAAPSDPIAVRVAAALASFGGRPLHVEQLRGGMPREDDWAKTPAQPTILCTTVDQLGSRLLFRGYGVSERMAPVHAGLLGEDCLILLDEAHLSAVFAETLDGVERWRSQRETAEARRPWEFSALTATPSKNEGDVFALSDEEKSEKAIRARLEAAKHCTLPEPKVATAYSADHLRTFADAAERLADDLAKAGVSSPTIALVVNRVPFARTIFEALASEHEAILLTGRVRPVERDALIERYRNRLFAGERKSAEKPLFVVATQCVEAGADFDFDALVTQIAPLDALRQRFGRLDRLGAKNSTQAVLIAAKDEVSKSAKDDPIYGDRAKATWAWLNEHASPAEKKGDAPSVDFGPNAMAALIEADSTGARDCVAASKSAPVLRGADLAFLSMTHPRPYPDPEIGLFLHGELGRDTDVSIVWRADIEDCFKDGEENAERLGDILDLVPPRSNEALRIPLWQARAWLRDDRISAAAPLADVDAPALQEERAHGVCVLRVARRVHGDKNKWEFIEAARIKAGDTLIAPSSRGGCDRFGWAPESEAPVDDIADAAAKYYERQRAFLRLHPALWPKPAESEDGVAWNEVSALIALHERSAGELVKDLLHVLAASPEGDAAWPALRARLERLRRAEGIKIERPYDGEDDDEAAPRGAVLWTRRGLKDAASDEAGEAVTDEGDAGSFMAQPLKLSVHRVDVEGMARGFARAAGLSLHLAESVALAALLHDDGKADPRFQAYLVGGTSPKEPLAKGDRRPRGEDRAARRDAHLPEYWRHEALSVRLAIAALEQEPRSDIDEELVVWLVGTHHGYGRPFFPHDDAWDDHARTVNGVALVAAPGPQRLDFEWNGPNGALDWAQLFEALKRRYGVWGLAYLEAIVRLADHRASEMRERTP
jgi:CRISPR-associated endonuclease/helicase Cas3